MRPRPMAGDARVGDVAYVTISPGDEVRASAFYGTLFGWEIAAGNVPRGLRVDGPLPMTGIWGGTGRQTVTLMYVVEDVTGAVARVRASGGTASDPEQQPLRHHRRLQRRPRNGLLSRRSCRSARRPPQDRISTTVAARPGQARRGRPGCSASMRSAYSGWLVDEARDERTVVGECHALGAYVG